MVGGSFDVEINGKPFHHFDDATYANGAIVFWSDSTSNRMKLSNVTFTKI